MSADSACLSVVIPTRNVARTIEACLQSVCGAAPRERLEVIVVDNGSSDATLELAARFPVRVERIPGGFVSRSRNVGARLARHPFVAFVDSDCVVREEWLGATLAALGEPRVAVAGCRHELRDAATWVERAWDRAHRKPLGRGLRDVAYVPAGNLAARRDVFLEVNGFDETLETGEDPDLCARIAARGHRVVQAPGMRCVHLGEPRTLGDVFRRERWHGRGARLRYGDGRIAPITISTAIFIAAVAVAIAGVAAALAGRVWWPAAAAAAPLAVPAVYAAAYAKAPRVRHALPLLLVYVAYFAGRAAALPVAARRALAGGARGAP